MYVVDSQTVSKKSSEFWKKISENPSIIIAEKTPMQYIDDTLIKITMLGCISYIFCKIDQKVKYKINYRDRCPLFKISKGFV